MKRICLSTVFLLCLSIVTFTAYPQGYESGKTIHQDHGFTWPEGKQLAISLTFDDARLSQADTGIALLDKHQVKATFYVSPRNFIQRTEKWKDAAMNGHDIGNHTLSHPCTGNFIWSRDNALEDYSLDGMIAELDSASRLIESITGIYPVSFAYPCGQTYVGRGLHTASYVPLIASRFSSGRTWMDEAPNDPSYCDFARLTGMELDGRTFEEVMQLIEEARENGSWLVLAGHEMGEGGRQTSRLSTIDAICQYAMDPANGIWIDHVGNIAAYVREQRGTASGIPQSGE